MSSEKEAVSVLSVQNESGNNDKVINRILTATTIFLVIATGLAVSFIPFVLKINQNLKTRSDTPVDKIIRSIINESLDVVLPTRFVINDDFILPPSDQMQRGTCWIFATLFLLESQYRENGIRKGFLNKDEYVLFSKQAYGSYVLQECNRDHSSGVCRHGAPAHNTTDDHLIPTLYYLTKAFPNLTRSILPEAVCPYQASDADGPENDYKCDGMWEAIETNPIQFKIKSMEAARDVRSTKRLLVKSQRPLGLSFPFASFFYYAPCDNQASNYSNTDFCSAEKRVSCPAGYKSKYCAKIEIEMRNSADGTFQSIDDPTRISITSAHEINIIGYNDDFVHKNRKISSITLPTFRGGFITHNSWRGNGHSVEYYMGRRSEENEAVICPNHNLSSNWIPTTFNCISKNRGDVTKCGQGFKFVRGKNGLANHTDLLGCKNSKYCDPDRYYALLQSPDGAESWSEPLYTGFDLTHLVSWKKDTIIGDNMDFRNETFDFLPFQMLYSAFYPVNYVPNDEDNCGYWLIPYKTVEMVNMNNWQLLDTYYVVDMEFEFTDSSYSRSGQSKKFNTTLLDQSLRKFIKPDFDGPLPYNYVY